MTEQVIAQSLPVGLVEGTGAEKLVISESASRATSYRIVTESIDLQALKSEEANLVAALEAPMPTDKELLLRAIETENMWRAEMARRLEEIRAILGGLNDGRF